MKRATYESPLFLLEHDDYRTGTRDYTPIQERYKQHINVKDVVDFINSKIQKLKLILQLALEITALLKT